MSRLDAIVLGLGGMGSAALWHLARRGHKVLGLDQFGEAHDRGSSHGGSRLIRRAYFEHPDYVPRVSRAYELWKELEEACGRSLFHRTGLFLAGDRPGPVIDGVLRASHAHHLKIELLSHDQAKSRFPSLRAGADQTILYEPDAGFLEVENCVRAHLEQAAVAGAGIQLDTKVLRWSADSDSVQVVTGDGIHRAKALVLCAGSWSRSMLSELCVPLVIRRKVVVWFRATAPGYRVADGCPVFCFDTPQGFFYGFPSFEGDNVKVGEHSGGEPVAAPETLDRELHDCDLAPLERFIANHLPFATPEVARHSVCMYTMTPDEHFIVDRHPRYSNVLIACGFSGHGFKFASVVGSALADMVSSNGTTEPIGFLGFKRLLQGQSG